ncbi:DUF3489 domain-containing protein [Ruegeria pomeroyi]|uniref:DUF3489 domain-containing protein n=1 Tax=Ruegeria pomeroyi TaxID=89184 RepID=A0A9Q3ZT24_9RHOB|nr:DUF3489 domain-containing protein [Ruegeria pomeroyi]MCE8540122.1 DUF3489 domain-containing protein [Ruegeria pomeroyi]
MSFGRGRNGSTIGEIAAALKWTPHIVRGAISGMVKKRLGPVVSSEKVEGRGGVYRLARARFAV